MRLFTGLDLPPEVVRNLEELLRRLKPAAQISWNRPENLHITTKFIGELAEARLGELKQTLDRLPGRAAIPVRLRRVGFLPNPHSPRMFRCGIEAPGLDALAADTDAAVAAIGVARETRPYSPHLTLARIKQPGGLRTLREAVAGLPSLEFGEFEARSFFLFQSVLKPAGSVYTKLSEFPLLKS
jgi:2'-5' RNA ligase